MKKKISSKWVWVLVLVIIVVIGCLYFLYTCVGCIQPRGVLLETKCRQLATAHCTICKSRNWVGIYVADKELQECAKEVHPDKIPEDLDDCSTIKQFCSEVAGIS